MVDIDGTWEIRIQTGKGERDWFLVFERGEGDTFTGTMTNPPNTVPLESGKVDGDHLSWELTMAPPNPVHVLGSATLSGDVLTGALDMGAYGVRNFSGKRA